MIIQVGTVVHSIQMKVHSDGNPWTPMRGVVTKISKSRALTVAWDNKTTETLTEQDVTVPRAQPYMRRPMKAERYVQREDSRTKPDSRTNARPNARPNAQSTT
jgi:hypothetical protein